MLSRVVVVDWAGGGEEAAVEALEAGADEYVGNASRSHELRARVHNQLRLKRRLDTLQRLRAERNSLRFDASLDSLTGVLNRNALDRALVRLSQECVDFSVVFLDVYFFKMINDTFGHGMGGPRAHKLRRFAQEARATERPGQPLRR